MVYGFDSRRRYKTRPLSFHEPKGRVFLLLIISIISNQLNAVWEIYKNPPLPYFDMYYNGGFRFMILPSAPLSGFQDNGTISRNCDKRVVIGFKFNRLRLSAQEVNG